MPTNYTVNAVCATPEIEFLKVTMNGTKVPLKSDTDGNFSGSKVITLPDSFAGHIEIAALRPTAWTVSVEVLTIPDAVSVLKQDIKGTIKETDNLEGSWTGNLTLTRPAPAAQGATTPGKDQH